MRFDIIRYASVTSTMDMASRLAESGANEGTLVVADEQTAGRGRSSHNWYSPPGQSLYMSLILRPDLAPAQTGWLNMIAALAVVQAIKEIRDSRLLNASASPAVSCLQSLISIKWFNDIQISSRKVCGILVESSITGDSLDYAVLGIGLNVNTRFDDAPEDIRARATSLREAWNAPESLDRTDGLTRILKCFKQHYTRMIATRLSPAREYAQAVETLGREVHVNTGHEIVSGLALRVADDGALIVLTADGERRVGFGDITSQ
jgi:BirA family transcriptional regulator, biotin operon repressor / biotin---[acetyl-CoA-carboxylase] ligase